MELNEIKKIAVVGAGTMGAGIAQLAAMAGYETVLFDIKKTALKTAMVGIGKNMDGAIARNKISETDKANALALITTTDELLNIRADVIIEAIIERLESKVELFQLLSEHNKPTTIFATNTSSIPITQIGAQLDNPERLVGMHFFNPAHIMKLVEIIEGVSTSEQVAKTTKLLAEKMGKKAVVAKDAPGFIVNRVARHFYVEGLKVLEEKVGDVETIDALVKASGFRMGPFELMDLIGVDTNLSVTTSMFERFNYDSKFRPNRIQQQLVDAGNNGRKSGKGFYDHL